MLRPVILPILIKLFASLAPPSNPPIIPRSNPLVDGVVIILELMIDWNASLGLISDVTPRIISGMNI